MRDLLVGMEASWSACAVLVLFVTLFVGLVTVVYLPSRKVRYDRWAKLPLNDELK